MRRSRVRLPQAAPHQKATLLNVNGSSPIKIRCSVCSVSPVGPAQQRANGTARCYLPVTMPIDPCLTRLHISSMPAKPIRVTRTRTARVSNTARCHDDEQENTATVTQSGRQPVGEVKRIRSCGVDYIVSKCCRGYFAWVIGAVLAEESGAFPLLIVG